MDPGNRSICTWAAHSGFQPSYLSLQHDRSLMSILEGLQSVNPNWAWCASQVLRGEGGHAGAGALTGDGGWCERFGRVCTM